MPLIKISAKSARLGFNGCKLDYMRDVCHGRCCDAPKTEHGCLVSVTKEEAAHYKKKYDIDSKDGMLVGNGKCPFKQSNHLCSLHNDTFGKPAGCRYSPFTLNKNDTVVIKNRNKMFKCFKAEPNLPAYKVYFESLVAMLGRLNAEIVAEHLNEGKEGDIYVTISDWQYAHIKEVLGNHHK